jgi:hypothetical protein
MDGAPLLSPIYPAVSLGCRLLQFCTLTTSLVLTFYLLSFLLQQIQAREVNPSNPQQEIEIKMAVMAIRTLQPLCSANCAR